MKIRKSIQIIFLIYFYLKFLKLLYKVPQNDLAHKFTSPFQLRHNNI